MYQVVFFIIYYHTYYIWYKMCINIYLFKGAHMLTVTNLKYHFSTFLFGTPLFSHISNVSFMQNTILVPFISVIFFCVCVRAVCVGEVHHCKWRVGIWCDAVGDVERVSRATVQSHDRWTGHWQCRGVFQRPGQTGMCIFSNTYYPLWKKNKCSQTLSLSLSLFIRCTCLARLFAHRVCMSWCLAAGTETVNYGLPLRTFTPSSPKTQWTWFREWRRWREEECKKVCVDHRQVVCS